MTEHILCTMLGDARAAPAKGEMKIASNRGRAAPRFRTRCRLPFAVTVPKWEAPSFQDSRPHSSRK